MKNQLLIVVAIFSLVFQTRSIAQPGCPAINAGNDVNLPCGQSCANLYATPFESGNTTNYDVSPIPYTPFPYNTGTAILVNQDDVWSNPITLPFTFCFFGQPYTQVVVGSNGLLSFDNTIIGGSNCAYDLIGLGTLPSTGIYTNTIMGAYQDIDPTLGGTLRYSIQGVSPCRTFVISYNDVPLYDSDDFLSNCSSTGPQTHQIVLYETTNVIEMYIENKESCTDWNDGLAYQGIQNASGTVAFTVPGRNGAVWSAQNDAWRFTPNGPSIVQVNWYAGGALIDTGNSIVVCPAVGTTYTAEAVYTPCNGGTPVLVEDYVFVGLASDLIASIDSVSPVQCNTSNTGAAFASYSSGSAVLSYGWIPGPQNTTSITNVGAGTYVFYVINADSCLITDTIEILTGAQFTAVVTDSSFFNCQAGGSNGSLLAETVGGIAPFSYQWSNGQTGQYATNLPAGTFTVTITDAANCSASDAGQVSFQVAQVGFNPPQIQNVGCNGTNNGGIAVSVNNATNPVSFSWSGGLPPNDTVFGLAVGTYTVTATDANGCTASASYNVGSAANTLTVNISATPLICYLATNGSATANATGGSVPYSYSWNSGEQTQTISNLSTGIVLVTVTDGGGCTASASTILNQSNPISYNSQINQPNCASLGFGTELLTPRGTVGSVIVDVTGIGTDTLSMTNGDTTAVFNNVPTGNYTFTLTDSLGCSVNGSFFVLAGAANETFNVDVDSANCFGVANGAVTVTANSTNRPYSYSINGGPFQPDSVFNNLAAGTYTIVTLNSFNCLDTLTAIVGQPQPLVVNASPDTLFTIPGAENQLSVTTQNFTSPVYAWTPTAGLSCTDCNNPVAAVEAPTVFTVFVSESGNTQCGALDSVVVLLGGRVVMPNAFSPNGDGKNDVFFPRTQAGEAEVNSFRIYNRWGELVHDAVTPWVGDFKNSSQPAGTYIYYVTYMETNSSNQKVETSAQGSFTLLR